MECKCVQCKYEWKSNIKRPKACPRCKRYDWKKKKDEFSELEEGNNKQGEFSELDDGEI